MSKPGCKPYKWVKAPKNHPFATKNGLIQEHRLVAEQLVNRHLFENEVVHHIDGNTLNNNVANLMIFATAREHNAFHLNAPTWSSDGIVWHSSALIHTSKCQRCGKIYTIKSHVDLNKSKYCSINCLNKSRHENNNKRIPKILNLIRENNGNFSAVAREIGMTSSGISKLLKMHGEKYHAKDYKVV